MDRSRMDELLKASAGLMLSPDYKERFLAEVYQVYVRTQRLEGMLSDWERGTLSFTPTCPKNVLFHQLVFMKQYFRDLVFRAQFEDIALPEDLIFTDGR